MRGMAPKPIPSVRDASNRCAAEVCFPVNPYLHVRCLGLPGHDLPHTAATTVPTSHASFAEMTTVDLIWWGQP